jgi:transposase
MFPTLLMCLNDFVKGRIISLFEEGKTQELISKKFNIYQSTVSRTIAKYRKTDVNNLANTGRPRIFDTDDRSVVISINKKNPKFSLRKISKEYRFSAGKDINYVTVKNILN